MGIFAHIDAGKTSLTERILFLSGRRRVAGTVDEGTTATDFLRVERERGITVKAACVQIDWKASSINLIDTPGHVDFGAEVERSLRVLDGAVLVLCAVAGVQARTEGILKAAARRNLPRIAFVNKMDRRGASFSRAVSELSELDRGAVPVQLPQGEGPDFAGILDLVSMTYTAFPGSDPKGSDASGSVGSDPGLDPAAEGRGPGPALFEEGRAARARLVEALAEGDEAMMEAFAAGREPGVEELRAALRAASVAGRVTPVLCGSALVDTSVAFLLDAVKDLLPGPAEAGCPEGSDPATGQPVRRDCDPAAPFSSFVFKTQADEHFGRLSWLRIWSGSLAPGDRLVEAGTGAVLRVQRIFSIQADALEDRTSARAGDIVAAAFSVSGKSAAAGREGKEGQRSIPGSTGSSLCAPGAAILYEALDFSEPVVSLALEPFSRADGESLSRALSLLLEDDPSLRAREDGDTGRIILSGMGELHLDVAVERLRTELGVRIRAGQPQVSYREALSGPASAECDFDRDMNGERVRAQLSLRLSPRARGSGKLFSAGPGFKVPAAQLAAFQRGVEASLSVGPSAGWPVDDVEAVFLSFSPPASRQVDLVLEIAASIAAHEALAKAGGVVLEPWMRVEVEAPEDCLGAAVAAITGRGGRVEAVEDSGGTKFVSAAAPLRLLFGFETELRSSSAGRASHQARFLRYEPRRS
jgi:elongation factor G